MRGGGGTEVGEVGCTGDGDLGLAELGIVEEESGFGGTDGRMGLAWLWEGDRQQQEWIRVTHVSFSKVTVALCGLSDASEAGVTEREVILPLLHFSIGHGRNGFKRTRS